ncbi:glycoside hydrolase family 97 protein [Botryobacter ruber]|uniref:glycoside hydrolase family 97 protein n=1 Tax=Botryobacter ruber TaxID=2171629 RepID=UPI001F0BD830|nr:glycoside hydrolase family 97 protein [Botryobacter ruber]
MSNRKTSRALWNRIMLFACGFLFWGTVSAQQVIDNTRHSLTSPDKNYTFTFYQKASPAGKKQMYYEVSYKGKPVILESELGVLVENQLFESALAIENDPSQLWGENLDLKNVSRSSNDTSWKPVYGERSTVRDHYNEMVVEFEKFGAGDATAEGHGGTSYDRRRSYQLHVVVRAYNEGVAYRYHFPENNNGLFMHITGEQTQFTMPEGTMAYHERWAQGPYNLLPLKGWTDESERPLTMTLQNGLTVSLTEAEMVDYARTKFRLSDTKPNTLQASMYDNVDAITPYSTPWRVVMAAERPGDLIQNNYLILNLNPENKLKDTSWIKPGKVFRSGLSMKEAQASVDFAHARNLQYVHLDAGWYGPEMKVASDATKVIESRDIDMEQLTKYAAEKNIGVIVYVNQRALVQQMDELFPLYQKWGLKGIKFGFVQIGSNRWSNWMHEAVKKAAEHKLMVNIHDEYRPTGFSRTYPNLMTQEGIRGNEEMPDATHNTILPFTRYIAGAGDYTICYYNNRIKTTRAHQLALSVVTYSPLQYMYWYDTPAHYGGEPEIEFFEKVKTVWDDTRVLSGAIGEHIVTARRSGDNWFVGAITNNEARQVSVPLNFADPKQKYVAHIYVDDDKATTKTKVGVQKYLVDAKDVLRFKLKASGGAAIHLEPVSGNAAKQYKKLPKQTL